MKLLYHVMIVVVAFFAIPELFFACALYWSARILFAGVVFMLRLLMKAGIIDPSHPSTLGVTNAREVTYYERRDRILREKTRADLNGHQYLGESL